MDLPSHMMSNSCYLQTCAHSRTPNTNSKLVFASPDDDVSVSSYPNIKLGGFSKRPSLWGEETEPARSTPLKQIADKTGKNLSPSYADELKKDSNYKVLIHKQSNSKAKEQKKRA